MNKTSTKLFAIIAIASLTVAFNFIFPGVARADLSGGSVGFSGAMGGTYLQPGDTLATFQVPFTQTPAFGVSLTFPLGTLLNADNINKSDFVFVQNGATTTEEYDVAPAPDYQNPVNGVYPTLLSFTIGHTLYAGSPITIKLSDTASGNEIRLPRRTTDSGYALINSPLFGSGVTFNNLTLTRDVLSGIHVEVAADGSGEDVAAQTIRVGDSLTAYAISTDQYGNFYDNVAANWTLEDNTGGIVDSNLVPAGDGKSAVFTATATGTFTIKAAKDGLTPVKSGVITVIPPLPGTVRNLTAHGDYISGLSLSWDPPTGGGSFTEYKIAYRPLGGNWSDEISATSTTHNFTISDLAPNSIYDFSVYAYDSDSSSSGEKSEVDGYNSGAPHQYSITDCQGLQTINSDQYGSYSLTQDIDCSGVDNFTPISVFKGTLDGNYYAIKNLNIDDTDVGGDNVGLFRELNGATVENLSLDGGSITTASSCDGDCDVALGSLAGYSSGSTINNVSSNLEVSQQAHNQDYYYVGGLIGDSESNTFNHDSFTGEVSGLDLVGGLLGYSSSDNIATSFVKSSNIVGSFNTYSGQGQAGGFIGSAEDSQISNSYAAATVSSGENGDNNIVLGGFIGQNDWSSISDCYSASSLTVGSNSTNATIGGFIGYLSSGDVMNSFASSVLNLPKAYNSAGDFFASVEIDGEYSGTILNLRYYSASDLGCGNDFGEECQAASPNLFYSNDNSPLADWDFSGIGENLPIWHAVEGSYPELTPTPQPQSDIYVSKVYGYEGGASLAAEDGHILGENAFSDISSALNAVTSGGTIHVAAASLSYRNEGSITINKPVTISGPGTYDPAKLFADGNILYDENAAAVETDCENSVFNINSSGVTIEGLVIRTVGEGYCYESPVINFGNMSGSHTNIRINNNYIAGGLSGIRISDSLSGGQIDISNNDINHNSENIYIGTMFGTIDADNFHINHNRLHDSQLPQSSLEVNNVPGRLDVTGNWWGGDMASSTGPLVSGDNGNSGDGDVITIGEGEHFIWYRPYCLDKDCTRLSSHSASSTGLTNLFNNGGTMTIPTGDTNSTAQINVNEDTIITIPVGDNSTVITLPAETVISQVGGGNFAPANLSAVNMATNNFSGFSNNQQAQGAFQWGIPGVGLHFEPAITVSMYVGTSLAGQTLNIRRSLAVDSGWTDDGLVENTCVVSAEGTCTFHTNKASYYVATKTVSSGGSGTSGSSNVQGGAASVIIKPIAVQTGNSTLTKLSLIIDNGIATTSSPLLKLTLNGDSKAVKNYAISLDKDFSKASLMAYSDNPTFVLPAVNGTYNLYLKYYSISGQDSEVLSQVITLVGQKENSTIKTGAAVSQSPAKYIFKRVLKLNDRGEDVRQLQIFLNKNGFIVSSKGAGAKGKETNFFGPATKKALINFQKKYKLKPYTGTVDSATLKFISSKP